MIVNPNAGTWVMALFIVALVIYLAATGRLPRRDGELDRLRKLEANMSYLQDEDIRKGQMIAKLQAENTELREKIRYLEGQLKTMLPTALIAEEHTMLVITGSDPDLGVDVAALRGVRNLRLTTLLATTAKDVKRTLDSHRRLGKLDECVHFAVHAGPEGIQLDRVVGREELSELLNGVLVVVIMGCTSAEIGDLLTVVPTVVAFNKPVAHDEAWQFAFLFWKAYAEGLTPLAAFNRAYDRSPTKIAEAAELIEA